MNNKNIIIFLIIFFSISGCQTLKEKSDDVVEKENQKYGKFVGKQINELKIELGNPSEDFNSSDGNIILIYKSKKFCIPCERKIEANQSNIIISFTSSGCI